MAEQDNQEAKPEEAKPDAGKKRAEPALSSALIKDISIVFGGLSLWAAADTWYLFSGMTLALLVSVVQAIIVGYLIASLFHEWGHYAGARLAGATTKRLKTSGLTDFRFSFDLDDNDQRQFHFMSFGGWVMHWGILFLLWLAIPLDSLGRIALVSSVFGFVVVATVIETGILRKTLAGQDPKETLFGLTKSHFRNAYLAGGIAGVFALATLS